MTITIESFIGKTYGSTSFEPLVTKGGIDASQAITSFEPLTTTILVQGDGNQFLPLVTAASDRPYGGVSVSFESLTTDASVGIPQPVSGVSSFAFLTTSGLMLTGGMMTGSSTFEPLVTLGSDHPCGHSSTSFEAMTSFAMEFPAINNWLYAEIPAITMSAGSIKAGKVDGLNASIGAIFMSEGRTGGQLKKPLGAITFAGAATIPNVGRLGRSIGAIQGEGVGRVSSLAVVNKKIGAITASGHFGGGLDEDAPIHITSVGSVITGSVSKLNKKIPAIVISAGSIVQDDFNALDKTIPAIRMLNGATLRMSIPAVTVVVATAEQIVAAEFIAYAMNMQNSPELDQSQQPGNAVTRYTNFPFFEIVRFGNKNYGVSKDGIFLLEGETDDGAPIAWQFDPFLSDFGSSRLKTISAAYAGGRIYGGVTYNLSVEEDKVNTYTFVTPRDSTAQNYRQVFGKGVRTRYVGVGISDPGGSDFNLESLNLEVNDMKRSI